MNVYDRRFIALGAMSMAAIAMWQLKDMIISVMPFALSSSLKSETFERKKSDDVLDERSVNIGVDFYSSQLRLFLGTPCASGDSIVRQQCQETIENKRRQLRSYEGKWLKIQQSK